MVSLDDGSSADVWTERIRLDTATAITSFVDGPLPKAPGVTVNRFGDGTAWYIGTRLEQTAVDDLIRQILRDLAIRPPIPMVTAPPGLEAVPSSQCRGIFSVPHQSWGRDSTPQCNGI